MSEESEEGHYSGGEHDASLDGSVHGSRHAEEESSSNNGAEEESDDEV